MKDCRKSGRISLPEGSLLIRPALISHLEGALYSVLPHQRYAIKEMIEPRRAMRSEHYLSNTAQPMNSCTRRHKHVELCASFGLLVAHQVEVLEAARPMIWEWQIKETRNQAHKKLGSIPPIPRTFQHVLFHIAFPRRCCSCVVVTK